MALTALTIALAGLGTATAVAAPATAADQPWGFEQVTPPDKGGGTVSTTDSFQPSPDGTRFLYTTTAPFDGVPSQSAPLYTRYIGTRTSTGWFNRALDPLFDVIPPAYQNYIQGVLGASVDLSYALVTSTRALTPGAIAGGGNIYMRSTQTGDLTLVAASADKTLTQNLSAPQGQLAVSFIANDGRSAIFYSAQPLTADSPNDGGIVLYGWSADSGLRVLSVLPDGTPVDGTTVSQAEAGLRDSMPVTDALSHVYFQVNTADGLGAGGVYVRSGNESRPVSVSQLPGAPSISAASVLSVSEGGRYALISTPQSAPALTLDTPTTATDGQQRFLYRYDFDSGALAYVGALSAQDFVGVLQMSTDGQTIVFESAYALSSDATAGTPNIYLWRDGALQLVATPDPGSIAGSDPNAFQRLLSPNGRYFSFTDNSASIGQRTGHDVTSSFCPTPSGDPGPCTEVYLYDSTSEQLACASCRQDGAAPAGPAGDPTNQFPGFNRVDRHQTQTVTDDGAVFFTSPDPLLPEEDSNGTNDAYAYQAGQFRLISRAAQNTSARFLDATPDGKTLFFTTDDAIVGTDTDQDRDIYATSQGAGFPFTEEQVIPPCSGTDCRGPFSGPATPLVPGTEQAAVPGTNPKDAASTRAKVSIVRAALSGSRLRLNIRVSSRGRIRVSNKALRTATRSVSRAGTYVVYATLAKDAKATLRKNKRLAVRARASLTPPFGRAAVANYRRTLRK